ncbi:hypothetical protein B0H13DRAFT_1871851 [Mycena leptocephala]|nr:hypothetical protein B0H13DRAFT_1871851 [Mycena leptocephala]
MALCGSGYEVESSTVFFSSSPDVPAAQLPELKLLKALTKELRSCVKSATPFHKAVRLVGTDVEKKLRLFPNAILGHDSSTNEWIVKLMPSGAHDVAANLLMAEIVNQYQVANNSNMSAICYPSGTQKITKDQRSVLPLREASKQTKASVVLRVAQLPACRRRGSWGVRITYATCARWVLVVGKRSCK